MTAQPQFSVKWPKQTPVLTDEQRAIREDFVRHWHEVLPRRYGMIERFNHGYVTQRVKSGRTLEIGSGLGEHIEYEDLGACDYTALELRAELAGTIEERFPGVHTVVGDCQEALPFEDGYFERVLAIHVLEHLPNLPDAMAEVHRVLAPDGVFQIVIPCEGGLAYTLARRVSAERIFRKRYGMDYDWFVRSEHLSTPADIRSVLRHWFEETHRTWFPLRVPVSGLNLVVGLELRPRRTVGTTPTA